jgi:hypothetical protein
MATPIPTPPSRLAASMPFVRSSGFLLLCLMLLCCFWPEARADLQLPIETRFGTLHRVEEKAEYLDQLKLDDQTIDISNYFHISYIFEWGKKGDVILVSQYSGGSGCCYNYTLVHIKNKYDIRSIHFGDRTFKEYDFYSDENTVSFKTRPTNTDNTDYFQITYDGENFTEERILEDDSNVTAAGAGKDVTRWLEKIVWDVLEDASERVRFSALMNVEQMNTLRSALGFSDPVKQQDGYIYGTSCRPHDCITGHGFFAIEIATGRPYAAYFDDTCTLTTFGAAEADLPAPMKALVDERRAEIKVQSDAEHNNFECPAYESRYIQKAEPTGDGSAD